MVSKGVKESYIKLCLHCPAQEPGFLKKNLELHKSLPFPFPPIFMACAISHLKFSIQKLATEELKTNILLLSDTIMD